MTHIMILCNMYGNKILIFKDRRESDSQIEMEMRKDSESTSVEAWETSERVRAAELGERGDRRDKGESESRREWGQRKQDFKGLQSALKSQLPKGKWCTFKYLSLSNLWSKVKKQNLVYPVNIYMKNYPFFYLFAKLPVKCFWYSLNFTCL